VNFTNNHHIATTSTALRHAARISMCLQLGRTADKPPSIMVPPYHHGINPIHVRCDVLMNSITKTYSSTINILEKKNWNVSCDDVGLSEGIFQ